MTFAWYAHLKELTRSHGSSPHWPVGALPSSSTCCKPGNRIGHTVLSVAQLKMLQEVITFTVFVPFTLFYLREPLKLDYLWAGLCILGAVYFIFRSRWIGG